MSSRSWNGKNGIKREKTKKKALEEQRKERERVLKKKIKKKKKKLKKKERAFIREEAERKVKLLQVE